MVNDPDIVSVSDSSANSSSTESSNNYNPTTWTASHAIYCDNISRSHRIFFRPGLRMFPQVRCPVAILPRDLPDMCGICMASIGECPQPCQWRPNYSRACSRRCDEQIKTKRRRKCPMWDIFEVLDSDVEPELFPLHDISRPTDPATGLAYDPLGGTIYLRPLNFEEVHSDYLHLRDIMDWRCGDREEDHRRSMFDFQDALIVGNHQYLATMRRTGLLLISLV